jgi:hypothetical protein
MSDQFIGIVGSLVKGIARKVECKSATGVTFKTGFLTCVNERLGKFRVAAKEDRGIEGFYFTALDVSAVVGTEITLKPFV